MSKSTRYKKLTMIFRINLAEVAEVALFGVLG